MTGYGRASAIRETDRRTQGEHSLQLSPVLPLSRFRVPRSLPPERGSQVSIAGVQSASRMTLAVLRFGRDGSHAGGV